MAKTCRINFMVGATGFYANSDAVSEVYQRLNYARRKKFASGSGDSQVDRLIVAAGVELVSTSISYELDAIVDIYGDTISLAKVRWIIIENLTLTTGYVLEVSGDFALTVGVIPAIVYPGAVVAVSAPVDGLPVVNGSTDTLTLDSGSNTVSFNLIIGGND